MSDVDTKEAYQDSTEAVRHPHIADNAVDTAAMLVAGGDVQLDPEEAIRIRKKIDRHIMPMMCILYWIQFMDKTTLGTSYRLQLQAPAITMWLQVPLQSWAYKSRRIWM